MLEELIQHNSILGEIFLPPQNYSEDGRKCPVNQLQKSSATSYQYRIFSTKSLKLSVSSTVLNAKSCTSFHRFGPIWAHILQKPNRSRLSPA